METAFEFRESDLYFKSVTFERDSLFIRGLENFWFCKRRFWGEFDSIAKNLASLTIEFMHTERCAHPHYRMSIFINFYHKLGCLAAFTCLAAYQSRRHNSICINLLHRSRIITSLFHSRSPRKFKIWTVIVWIGIFINFHPSKFSTMFPI